MVRSLFLVPGLLLMPGVTLAQSASSDSQALQALVVEVRQLRQLLQTSAVATQRAQILIYRVQAQEAAVARAFQRLDDARSKLAETRSSRKRLAADLKRLEDARGDTENPNQNPNERKEFDQTIAQFKSQLESLAGEEQERQAAETECEEQLRTEQAKLSGVQEQLDQLDRDLENSIRSSGRNPR